MKQAQKNKRYSTALEQDQTYHRISIFDINGSLENLIIRSRTLHKTYRFVDDDKLIIHQATNNINYVEGYFMGVGVMVSILNTVEISYLENHHITL